MTNRPTGFLRAIFAGAIACTSIVTIPPNAEAAPGECLVARPKTAAPPGQFWLHLNDGITNRHCWVLRARVETTSQAKGAIAVQAARPATRATGAPPARALEDAATNEAATRTDSPQLQKDDGKAVSGTGARPDHADQSLSYAGHSDTAQLPPLASDMPDAAYAHAPASGATSTLAFAVRAQEITRVANPSAGPASIEASSTPAPSVAEATKKTREIRASHFLELMLSAIFFGPALYLLAARAFRRMAEPPRPPLPYTSLSNASSTERTLLPPPRESAAAPF
jgi:hypothetical protein